MSRGKAAGTVFGVILFLTVFSTSCSRCNHGHEECGDATLGLFAPGIQSTVWDDGSVAMTIPLQNQGENAANNVNVTNLDIPGGSRLLPASLPLGLGDFVPEAVRALDAHYTFPKLGVSYAVKLAGTYMAGSRSCKFEVDGSFTPQAHDMNPVPAKSATVQKQNPSTATYPPAPPTPPGEREFNARTTRAPQGQPRILFPKPPVSTGIQLIKAGSLGQPQPLPPEAPSASTVEIAKNTGGGLYGGNPPDPDAAGADSTQVVIYTANTGISYSTDGGSTFTNVSLTALNDPSNPKRTTFFPQSDGGLCCDQVVTYVPQQNIFVWLLQYWAAPITLNGKATTGPDRLRVAWATPAAIKSDFIHAWTYIDLTSSLLGLGNDWMDYPDLSFSDTFLYVGVDHAIQGTGSLYSNRHVIVRVSLSDMTGGGSTINLSYMDPTYNGLAQNHLVQNSHDGLYWSALPDTSTLTVYTWPDSSNTATPHDVKISSYTNTDYTVTAPDGPNWDTAPQAALGAARTHISLFCPPGGCPANTPDDFLYFAFSAGRDTTNNRAYPYVRIEKISSTDFSLVSEWDIWNSGYAFATAALGSPLNPGSDEISLSLATGGGGNYANNAVGFLNDFVVYITTDSDTTQASYNVDKNGNIIKDSNGNPTYNTRYGDYFDARNSTGPATANGSGAGYSTLGYAVKTATTGKSCALVGCSINLHYILWGRPGALNPSPPSRPR